MNSKNLWRRVLGSVLTLSDLVVAIFAFFGGMNMFNINVPRQSALCSVEP